MSVLDHQVTNAVFCLVTLTGHASYTPQLN